MKTFPVTEKLKRDLRDAVRGEVSFDPVIRGIHATDASHYQIFPACVVAPLDQADVQAALAFAAAYEMPITPRGGATALSGQTFGPGMVLDLSRHVNRVLEINADQCWARVQPGVVRDHLNQQLAPHGLQFAPDPATSSRATVGGMIGNNSAGTRSIVHGRTVDHVLETEVVLTGGRQLSLKEFNPNGDSLSDLEQGIQSIVEANREEILARYPNIMRRVAGYNLDEFVDGAGYTGPIGPRENAGRRAWNLSHLIVGAEGTLATVTEAKLRLVPLPKTTALCLLHFHDEIESLAAVPEILEHGPSAVEMLDGKVLKEAKSNASTRKLADWIVGEPGAILIVEFSGERDEVEQAARGLSTWGIHSRDCYDSPTLLDPAEHKKVWETRRLGLGLISNVKGSVKGQAFVEDACVPVEVLAEYIDKLKTICNRRGVASTMYAHASVGVIHFRPELDLHLREHQEHMKGIADEAFELVVQYGGAFAGEHGDGQLRGEYVPRFYGPKLYEAFRQVKGLFDPNGLMNPGKIVDAPSLIDPTMLRYGTGYRQPEIPTGFRYGEQGGFRLAVEQCNGVGACRKVGSGVMCPSYMATREEQDSTRGRANALRLAMSGQLDGDAIAALGSDEVHKVLELCLSCKACKSECPNAVDMAKMKADALQVRYKQHGVPRSAKLFGEFPDQVRKYGSRFGRLAGIATKLPGARKIIEWGAGVDPRRPLPMPAAESLEKQLAGRASKGKGTRGKVVLFDDTFASFLEPNIGLAAFELLESLRYEVILANAGCCQRPRISVGLVDEAKQHGADTIAKLDKYAQAGLPIVCLEPSCASALAEDLPDLVDNQAAGKRVAEKVQLLESFLLREKVELECDVSELKLHGHCHQKAVFGTQDLHKLFASIEGTTLTEIDAGCCGMAGSFGYSHYELSKQIGEDRLFPAVREAVAAGQAIVAPGTSCRQQLNDFLGVEAKHWVEVVQAKADSKNHE